MSENLGSLSRIDLYCNEQSLVLVSKIAQFKSYVAGLLSVVSLFCIQSGFRRHVININLKISPRRKAVKDVRLRECWTNGTCIVTVVLSTQDRLNQVESLCYSLNVQF